MDIDNEKRMFLLKRFWVIHDHTKSLRIKVIISSSILILGILGYFFKLDLTQRTPELSYAVCGILAVVTFTGVGFLLAVQSTYDFYAERIEHLYDLLDVSNKNYIKNAGDPGAKAPALFAMCYLSISAIGLISIAIVWINPS